MPNRERPDIVLIMTDQQRADTIAAHGHPHMVTPNMDRLVRNGRTFTRAYCPGATCVASRAAMFTGRYAHNTGAHSFFDWGHHRTWVHDLAEAGYYCANIGKMHFQPRDTPGGFHDRIVVENPTSVTNWGGYGDDAWGNYLKLHGHERPNHRHRTDPEWKKKFQGVPWHLPEHLHSDIFTGNTAVQWIRHHDDERPLFLQIGFPGPHEPWDPLERHLRLYENADLPMLADWPGDLEGKPPQHQAHREFHAGCDHESRIAMDEATLDDVRRMQRHYFAKVSLIDEQVGRVLDALEAAGRLDNSLIVFCSDHGEMLGDHRLAYKWLMYESIVRVPLIVSGPGVEPGEDRNLASLIDLGPSLLDWVGAAIPTRLEGGSLAPAWRGEGPTGRRYAFCEDNYMIMMAGERFKMVYYLGQELGELYDLAADPAETRNLWNDPAHRETRESLRAELLEWLGASAYYQSGHHCGEGPDYERRWPGPDNAYLHGDTFRPKTVEFL